MERLAFDELHGNERPTAIIAHFVDRADIRVIESRGRTCLARGPMQRRGIGTLPRADSTLMATSRWSVSSRAR